MPSISEALDTALQHHQGGRLHAAEEIYRRILQEDPNQPDAIHLLGVIAHQRGKHELAIESIQRAIGLKESAADFHNNLAKVYGELHRLPEAIASCRRALELNPEFAEAHNNLGNAFREQWKLDEAVSSCRRALEIDPGSASAHNNLGNALKAQAKLEEAVACYQRAVELRPDFAEAHSNLIYAQIFHPGCDAPTLREEHRRWNQRQAAPLEKLIQPHLNDRSPDRRLRVGYVSPDFRDHCQALFTTPLFSSHDRERFEIVCYSDVLRPDRVTERLRFAVDVWRDITRLDDEQAAGLVRRDRIDILVDLTMHMAYHRLLLFARKPAPVQACWLAYPGTTGLSAIDYRLTDPHLDPPGLLDLCYSEASIRLPDSFWCYDPLATEPAVNALPALKNGFATFGCLNNFCKVNPFMLKLWARVLNVVADSRLILLADEGTHCRETLDLLEGEGVARERVAFVARQPRALYLRQYHGIDLGLDTVPYNGHTTSLDSFWMGVPVVTLVGSTVVGRAGLSQLTNLGLPELIAADPDHYVRIAAELARDLPRLSRWRATLRDRMQASPLMNAPRFAQNVEAAYRQMWQRWCTT